MSDKSNPEVKRLLSNKTRGHAIWEQNATRLNMRAVLCQTVKATEFKGLTEKEHVLEVGHYVDVVHGINGKNFVATFIGDKLIHGTIRAKYFVGAEIILKDGE